MTYEIKKGEPNTPRGGQGNAKYPLPDLEIGEYFFVPGADIRKISANCHQAMRFRRGCTMKKFVCRSMSENGIKGVAVFRIAHPHFDNPEIRKDLFARKSDKNPSDT